MVLTRIVLIVALVSVGFVSVAFAQDQGHGFADLYFGGTHLFKSDVPTWEFNDTEPVGGARVGFWLGRNWGLTLRGWYYQTDAKEEGGLSTGNLDFIGVALELLARWPLSDRWALYGTLGPALAVATLDRQIDPTVRGKEDARSVAAGVSGSVVWSTAS